MAANENGKNWSKVSESVQMDNPDKGRRGRRHQLKLQEAEDFRRAIEASLQDQSVEDISATLVDQSAAPNKEDDEQLCFETVEETESPPEEFLMDQAQLSECGAHVSQYGNCKNDSLSVHSNCSTVSSATSVVAKDTATCSYHPRNDEEYDDDGDYNMSGKYEGAHADDDVEGGAKATWSISSDTYQDPSFRFNNVRVTLCQGHITKQKMDALVNVTSPQKTLEGGLSAAFLKTGGYELEVLFETANEDTGTVRCTEVPADLGFKCSYILHVTLQKSPEHMSQSIDRAMRDIADFCRKHDIRSIAIPPLGVGRAYCYPADDVACHMIVSIHQHLGHLQERNIVIHENDIEVYDNFKEKLQKYDMEGIESFLHDSDLQRENQDHVHQLSGRLHTPLKERQRIPGDTRTRSLRVQRKSNHSWSGSLQQRPETGFVRSKEKEKPRGLPDEMFRSSVRKNPSLGSGKIVWSRERGGTVGDGSPYKKSFQRHSSVSDESKKKIRQIIKDNGVTVKQDRSEFILLGNQDAVDQAHVEIMKELSRKVTTNDKKSAARKKPSDMVKYMVTDYDPSVPKYWKNFKPDQSIKAFYSELKNVITGNKYEKVKIDTDSSVHKTIVQMMNKTFNAKDLGQGNDAKGLQGYTKLWVVKVERIENISLYDVYAKKRQDLFRELLCRKEAKFKPMASLPKCSGPCLTEKHVERCSELGKDLFSQVNESYMFHGTQETNVKPICNTGLDPRLCQSGAMLGQGIYGAESAMKADQYTDDSKNRTWGKGEKKKMFLIRMLLGDCFISRQKNPQKYVRPPCKGRGCYSDTCRDHSESSFNSIVSDCGKLFREFVVYHQDFCYPEYLITYERR